MHGVECFFPKRMNGRALEQACMRAKLLQSCPAVCDPVDYSPSGPSENPMGFSRQEYWSGLLCPSPGVLPDPGVKSASLMSHALAGGFFFFLPLAASGRPLEQEHFFSKKKFFQESENPRSSRHPNTIFKIKVFIWP